ncbi:MAG: sulfatase [Gemmatimonadaceae bacterium]|jgi:arylsulfatase A-like enzyme|nr:sulfatase [Gemmatimonadaceae bacterium]
MKGITAVLTKGEIVTGKPNIVYVLTDQWRAQAFGYAGDPNVKTPNIDALAARSLSFENTVSVCPVCTPHRAALLTGRYPTSTGMFLNDLYLPSEELCMAEILKGAGYETGYVGKWHLDGHGRDSYIPPERRQGFDYWKVLECTHDYNNSCYYAGDDPTRRKWEGYDAYPQTEDAKDYIREHADRQKPFFLFVGFGGPHFPHDNAPEELVARYPVDGIELRPNVPEEMQTRAREELQGYYAHCTAIDSCVGALYQTLEECGEDEDTIFVFASDHGDMFGSQGKRPWRKQVPWDEAVRVPFLLRYPAIHDTGRSVQTPLNTPEILPSLLSLAGVDIPDTIEGEDLSRLFRGDGGEEERAAIFMSVAPFGDRDHKAYRGVRTARYSYVRDSDGPWLLYDNRADPYQMKNLIEDPGYAGQRAALEAELQSQLGRNRDTFPTAEEAIAQWGYSVDEGGNTPYRGEFRVQSPGSDPGEVCRF